VQVNGTVTATGEGTFNGGHTVSQHKHGGVQTGGGSTGTPTG
jgi:phage baseplate assembly protein gpV